MAAIVTSVAELWWRRDGAFPPVLFSPAVHSRKTLSAYQALSFMVKSFPGMVLGVLDISQKIILTFCEVTVSFL